MAATGRIKQGVRALFAFMRAVDWPLVSAYLNHAQMALFQQLRHSEQLHSVNVLKSVLAQADSTPHDLAVAALLHDVGKIRAPLMIWQKSLAVIVRKVAPAMYRRWSVGERSMFAVIVYHPAWGAELVAPTGASDCVVWLIRHHADSLDVHADHPCVDLLRRLKQADDAN